MSSDRATSVLIIDRDTLSRAAIKNFCTQQGIRVAGETEGLASGLSMIKGLRPDIAVLELPSRPDETLDAVRALKAEYPQMGIILTANDKSPQLILNSMRAGAQEYLTRPLDTKELGEAIKRLAAQAKRSTKTKADRSGRIVSVFSNKGGVGVTSVAANLAVSLAKKADKKTVIVDLNLQMGDVALMFNLRPPYSLADAMTASGLDESRLRGLLDEHESGVFVLSAPEDPVEAEKISPGMLMEVFGLLKGMFDYIVVDAGHNFDSRVLEVLNLADTILVLSVLDVPTVRNARRCLTLFGQLGYSPEKVRLVVNRWQKKTKVTVEDLEATAMSKVFWQIPNDYKTLIAAIDAGEPAAVQSPRSKLSRNIEELALELCDLHSGESPEVEEDEPETRERQTAGR